MQSTVKNIQKDIENRLSLHPKVLIDIMHFVYETITDSGETEIYVNNAKSILKYPEYNDVEKAEKIFTFLDDKENLKKLVASSDADGIEAKIGKENNCAPKVTDRLPAISSGKYFDIFALRSGAK